MKKISDDIRKSVTSDYINGDKPCDIIKRYNISSRSLSRIVQSSKEALEARVYGSKSSSKILKQVKKLYLNKIPASCICKKLNLSHSSLVRLIAKDDDMSNFKNERRLGHGMEDIIIMKNGNIVYKSTRKKKKQSMINGYPAIWLKSKPYYVHRLVAKKFIPNPENKPEVNHIDGNKHNNRVNNLEWVTSKENHDHALRTGLNSNHDFYSGISNPKAKPILNNVTGKVYGSKGEYRRELGLSRHEFENFIMSADSITFISRDEYYSMKKGETQNEENIRTNQ